METMTMKTKESEQLLLQMHNGLGVVDFDCEIGQGVGINTQDRSVIVLVCLTDAPGQGFSDPDDRDLAL